MQCVQKHMKELFRAVLVQIFMIRHKDSAMIETIRVDSEGNMKPIDFDMWKLVESVHGWENIEANAVPAISQSAVFTCILEETHVSYFRRPDE